MLLLNSATLCFPAGCISQLIVNKQTVDMGSGAVDRTGIVRCRTCGSGGEDSPCDNDASCTESYKSKKGYVCNCRQGFVGDNCQFEEDLICAEGMSLHTAVFVISPHVLIKRFFAVINFVVVHLDFSKYRKIKCASLDADKTGRNQEYVGIYNSHCYYYRRGVCVHIYLKLPLLLCTEDDNSCYRNVCKMSVVPLVSQQTPTRKSISI